MGEIDGWPAGCGHDADSTTLSSKDSVDSKTKIPFYTIECPLSVRVCPTSRSLATLRGAAMTIVSDERDRAPALLPGPALLIGDEFVRTTSGGTFAKADCAVSTVKLAFPAWRKPP
jgi:hypothetical protein